MDKEYDLDNNKHIHSMDNVICKTQELIDIINNDKTTNDTGLIPPYKEVITFLLSELKLKYTKEEVEDFMLDCESE